MKKSPALHVFKEQELEVQMFDTTLVSCTHQMLADCEVKRRKFSKLKDMYNSLTGGRRSSTILPRVTQ